MCASAATRVVEGGACAGLAKPLVELQGLGQGPSGVEEPFTSAHKMAAVAVTVLAAMSEGDNGPISKTGSLLRGNAKPASKLIKQLLCISEGTACFMSDTEKRNLATLRPCKRKKEGKYKVLHLEFIVAVTVL